MTNVMQALVGADWPATMLMAVLEAGARGVLLLGVVLAIAMALRSASAATRHAIVGAGFAVMLLLPLGMMLPWRIQLLPDVIGPLGLSGDGADAAAPGAPPTDLAMTVDDGERVIRFNVPTLLATESTAAADADRSIVDDERAASGFGVGSPGWAPLLIGIWMLGMLLLGARVLLGQWFAWRLVRNAEETTDDSWTRLLWESADRLDIECDVRLLHSRETEIAFATGILAPAIVLPRGADDWSDGRRRAVLMHELAHIRRRDLLLHHASRFASVLYWFNPLVWIGAARLRAESERAADDLVLGIGTRPSEYADHLLQIVAGARRIAMPGPVLPFARRREFEGRILAILEPRVRRTEPTRLQTVGLAATIGLLALPIMAIAPAPADDVASAGVQIAEAELPAPGPGPTPKPQPSPPAVPPVPQDEPVSLALSEIFNVDAVVDVDIDRDIDVNRNINSNINANINRNVDVNVDGNVGNANVDGAHVDADVGRRIGIVAVLSDGDGDPRAIAALIRLLQIDPDAEVRAAAAWGLGELDAAEAVDALATALRQDSEPRVRAAAAWALGEIEAEEATDALVGAMNDESLDVRRAAIHALAELETLDSASGLIRALSDPDPHIRGTAAYTLGEINLDRAPPELIALLHDDNVEVRLAAIRAVGEIEDPAAADALADALLDANEDIRATALWALMELETEGAIEALIRALDDASPLVRRMVAEALGDL